MSLSALIVEEGADASKPVRLYRSDRQLGWGYRVWREMVGELIASRELIWRLFLRDFSARYRQSVFGVLWALIMPVVAVGTFIFLNASGVLNVGETGIPYPAFALLGLTVWQLFAGGLVAATNAIVAGGTMVAKINFPKEALVIASLGQAVVETLIRIMLTVAVFAWFRVVPEWTAIFFPLALLPLFLFTLGLGLLLSLLNALLRDVANLVTLATTFLLFMTPVLYPEPRQGLFSLVSSHNPVAALVTGARDIVVAGRLTDPDHFLWASAVSGIVFLVSWRLFHMVEPRMAERV
jgi:lipopolysaccharide transport system permease protein